MSYENECFLFVSKSMGGSVIVCLTLLIDGLKAAYSWSDRKEMGVGFTLCKHSLITLYS